jgi:flagellar motor switch protein FliN
MKDAPMDTDDVAMGQVLVPSIGSAGDPLSLDEFDIPAGAPPSGVSSSVEGLEALYDVPVKVQAVLGRTRIPIGELLQLSYGSIVELDRRVGEPVDIYVNNRLIARGEVVLIENSLGVTLIELVREDV